MILCSCAVIRQDEMRDAIRELVRKNPNAPVTPNRVYKQMGKTPDCTDCAPLLLRRIQMIYTDIIVNEKILKGQEPPRRLK
jgi:bacterioferritin-associated ferredoxin